MFEIADIKRIPMSGIGSGMPSCVELCQIFRIHQAKCQMLIIHKVLYVQEVVTPSSIESYYLKMVTTSWTNSFMDGYTMHSYYTSYRIIPPIGPWV